MQNTTIIQKLQAKKNKKGFTLVELVIVIAILAILAAIAIPVIVSTINSANTSTFESDCSTVEMLLKAAINEQKGSVKTTYDGVSPAQSTVDDNVSIDAILKTNGFNGSLAKNIGGTDYIMSWDGTNLTVAEATGNNTALSRDSTIANGKTANVNAGTVQSLKAGTTVVAEELNTEATQ